MQQDMQQNRQAVLPEGSAVSRISHGLVGRHRTASLFEIRFQFQRHLSLLTSG
jgi:hypothetical protein